MKNKIYYESFKDAIERNRKKIPAVHKKLKAAGVQYVMSSWIDLHGIPKTKPVPMGTGFVFGIPCKSIQLDITYWTPAALSFL